MLQYHSKKQKFALLFLMLIFAGITGHTQVKRVQPVWWFGESGAANFNTYRGKTQMLNQSLTVPTAFHNGKGVKPYLSLLTEFRPGKVLGGMLNVAWDNRGGEFESVMAPCNCPATLSTKISYLAIEPSLRIAPFASAFYVFLGPTLGINLSKEFTYTQDKQSDTRGDWSDIKKTVFAGQAGAGIDIPLSARTSATQMTLSPFASYQTDFGHEPRSVESWSFYTFRAGMALKFGTGRIPIPVMVTPPPPVIVVTPPPIVEKDTDGDGIMDSQDKCPTVWGYARYQGCPIPDRDKDGVNDEEDKCPDVWGYARYQGCPIPDRDKDGVNDEEDRCPDVPGVKENYGCPLVKEEIIRRVNLSAKNIFFQTNSAKLLPKSFKALNEVVTILKEDVALKLDIEGHTDITGGDKINIPLSKNRGKSVNDYITTNGINASRLTSEGFSSSRPIADNKTTKGKALNRRVEMKLKYF